MVPPVAEGLVVRRDGTVVDAAAFGTAVPVDPGPHTIEARAPAVIAPAVIAPAVIAPAVEAGPPVAPSRSSRRTLGLVAGGVGLGGLAASLVVGALASRRYDQSNTAGGCANNRCTPRGLEDRSSASSLAAGATGIMVGGALLLGVGAVLYLTAPNAHMTVSVGPTAVTVGRPW